MQPNFVGLTVFFLQEFFRPRRHVGREGRADQTLLPQPPRKLTYEGMGGCQGPEPLVRSFAKFCVVFFCNQVATGMHKIGMAEHDPPLLCPMHRQSESGGIVLVGGGAVIGHFFSQLVTVPLLIPFFF